MKGSVFIYIYEPPKVIIENADNATIQYYDIHHGGPVMLLIGSLAFINDTR